jgi:hypothetical protein
MTDSIDRIHFQELSELDPMDVCRRALCHYDASNRWYTLSVWGTELRITPHRLTIESMSNNKHHLDEYFHLFAIHYLLGARVTDLANEWISEKDVAGGATFFRGPHRIPTDLIADRFNNNIDAFKARCNRFGGRSIQLADAAYVFTITPRIPVAVLYWCGDDDFAAESKILYDRTITAHQASDMIYALAVGICRQLGHSHDDRVD